MKIGIGIGYSGAKMNVPVAMVQRAEELGFYSVAASETYGSDAITPLAYMGALTKRLKLMTTIAIISARTPANLAMCAQTLDQMAGEGRVVIGLGHSGPQIVEGWYGRPWGKPYYNMKDYVAIMKKIWKREGPVTHDGQAIKLPYEGPGASGLAKPLKSILHGNPNIPILLGTTQKASVRLTAEIADGWMAMDFLPGEMDTYRPTLEEGFAKRSDGMTMDKFQVWAHVQVHMNTDVKSAINGLKPRTALYVGGMGAKEKNFHNQKMIRRGFPEAAARIQELFLAGRKKEAEEAVPDEYIDDGALVGPPERLRERLKKWTDCGLYGLRLNALTSESIEVFAGVDKG